jgi:hypothetical protein
MWVEGNQIQLEDIMLNEVSQAQKDKSYMFSLILGDRHSAYTTNIIKTSHAKGRSLTGEGG